MTHTWHPITPDTRLSSRVRISTRSGRKRGIVIAYTPKRMLVSHK